MQALPAEHAPMIITSGVFQAQKSHYVTMPKKRAAALQLSAMPSEERAAAFETMSPGERAAALSAMPAQARPAAFGALPPGERAAVARTAAHQFCSTVNALQRAGKSDINLHNVLDSTQVRPPPLYVWQCYITYVCSSNHLVYLSKN